MSLSEAPMPILLRLDVYDWLAQIVQAVCVYRICRSLGDSAARSGWIGLCCVIPTASWIVMVLRGWNVQRARSNAKPGASAMGALALVVAPGRAGAHDPGPVLIGYIALPLMFLGACYLYASAVLRIARNQGKSPWICAGLWVLGFNVGFWPLVDLSLAYIALGSWVGPWSSRGVESPAA